MSTSSDPEKPSVGDEQQQQQQLDTVDSSADRASTLAQLPSPPPSYWRLLVDNAVVTDDVVRHQYRGKGTESDPFVVEWLPDDARNPLNWSMSRRVIITLVMSLTSLAVSFSSSAYMSGAPQIEEAYHTSLVVVTLGLTTFNLGFATGPILWGPFSELYGRQIVFLISFAGVTLFNGACWGSQSLPALIVLRFFTGIFAASPLTNAGGIIADMFPLSQRGLAMSSFVVSPYLGPALGPIVSGFVAERVGWRWVIGVMTLFTGSMFILGALVIPETYAPFLLRRRAARLQQIHGNGAVYTDLITLEKGKTSSKQVYKTALSRPWVLLFTEPIITLLSIYMAIIYGTLYSFFGAFPIVYEDVRGLSQGVGGLAFIGVAVGMLMGVVAAIFINIQFRKLIASGKATPEKRLIPAMVGSILIPVSLFWWAFTTYSSINVIASIAAGAPFAMGMVLTYLAISNYVVDSYSVFSASALAANAFLRCIFGAVFPLFTPAQYENLGIHWAGALMAFLALACAPFPWLFYKFGPRIRKRCKYSAEAERIRKKIAEKSKPKPEGA